MELKRVNELIGEEFLKAMQNRTDVDFTKKALVKVLDQVMNDVGLENGRIKSKPSNKSIKPLTPTKPLPTINEAAIAINTPPQSPNIHPKTVYNTVIHNHHTHPTAPNYLAAAAYNNAIPHRNPFMGHNIIMEDAEMTDVLPPTKRRRI
jgi:hypothetical protein